MFVLVEADVAEAGEAVRLKSVFTRTVEEKQRVSMFRTHGHRRSSQN